MPFHIRDPETDILVRELARRRGIGLTDAVKLAVRRELAADSAVDVATRSARLRERVGPLLSEIDAMPRREKAPPKAFYDDLYGDA